MKKLKLLVIAPAIFSMVACANLGSEVKADKAKEIAAAIAKENVKVKGVKFDISVDGKDEDMTAKGSIVLKINEDGTLYFKEDVSGKDEDGDMTERMELYVAKDSNYEEVIYAKNYDSETKKDEIEVIVKKDNPMYEIYASSFELVTTVVTSMSTTAAELPALIEEAEAEKALYELMGDKAEGEFDVKYYSKGDLNLSIKTTEKYEDEEDGKKVTYTIVNTNTFDKGLFVSGEMSMTGSNGNKEIQKITASYADSYEIKLPSGWEKLIEE